MKKVNDSFVKKIVAWFQLVRLPNLFTVPGDAWVGYALVSLINGNPWVASQLIAVIAAVVMAYAGGVVQNDMVDQEEDAYGRAERPLVSGRIRFWQAGVFVALAWIAGAGLSWIAGDLSGLGVYLILLSCILSYNVVMKHRFPHLACLIMGVCRGTSLVLGAMVATNGAVDEPVLLIGAVWIVYIGGVTWIANGELYTQQFSTIKAFLPTFAMAAAFFYGLTADFIVENGMFLIFPIVLATVSIMFCWRCGCLLHAAGNSVEPSMIMRCVGSLLRLLIPMQLTMLLIFSRTPTEAGAAAVVLTSAGLFNLWISRWIAQT